MSIHDLFCLSTTCCDRPWLLQPTERKTCWPRRPMAPSTRRRMPRCGYSRQPVLATAPSSSPPSPRATTASTPCTSTSTTPAPSPAATGRPSPCSWPVSGPVVKSPLPVRHLRPFLPFLSQLAAFLGRLPAFLFFILYIRWDGEGDGGGCVCVCVGGGGGLEYYRGGVGGMKCV